MYRKKFITQAIDFPSLGKMAAIGNHYLCDLHAVQDCVEEKAVSLL